jgi:trk system potassium uptake protein TrkA
MNIIIAGAGAVGSQAAHVLCFRGNDVTVVDVDEDALVRLREHSDVMTLVGNAALPATLLEAGVEQADIVLALTGNSEANLVICTLAKSFGVGKKVARLGTRRFFDPDRDLSPELFGVDDFIIPEEDCVRDILDALTRPAVKESASIGPRSCEIVNFQVPPGSPLDGVELRGVPCPELLDRLRVCAIKRHGRLIVPRGDTAIKSFDEAYLAGNRRDVDEFIAWASPETRSIRRVLVTGSTNLALLLAKAVEDSGMTLSLVVKTEADAQRAIDLLRPETIVLCGESTDSAVLEEAAVGEADAVVAAGEDSEDNILTSILAQRLGAGKVISVVYNADYGQIIANLPLIDCGFNPLVGAVNSLLQHIGSDIRQHVALLGRIDAEILDLVVREGTSVAEKRIVDLTGTADMVFIAIFRGGEFVPPVGRETIRVGDRVAVLVRRNFHAAVERLFASKRLF